jgi:hypothetical protein
MSDFVDDMLSQQSRDVKKAADMVSYGVNDPSQVPLLTKDCDRWHS